jgi:hypothetical protein
MRIPGVAAIGFRVVTGILAASAWLGAAAAVAQTEASTDGNSSSPAAGSFPCEKQEKFREFDFWVGEWDVHTPDGKPAGRNVIESSERGCVLIERWAGAGGSTGISMNYLDATTDEWVQVWTDASGSQIVIRGGLTDSGMLLEGQIHYVSTGVTAPFRGLWTPQPDGRVRQFFEQSDDEGKTWKPWFEGFYTRVGGGEADADSG